MEKQLGHAAFNAVITTQEAVAANPQRTYLLLINDSDTALYLKLGAAAFVNQGIRLNANGGSLELSDINANLDLRAVNVIHAGSGNKALLITEG